MLGDNAEMLTVSNDSTGNFDRMQKELGSVCVACWFVMISDSTFYDKSEPLVSDKDKKRF